MRHAIHLFCLVIIGVCCAAVNAPAVSLNLTGSQWNFARGAVFTVNVVAYEITDTDGIVVSLTYPAEVVSPDILPVTTSFFQTHVDDLAEDGLESVWSAGLDTPGTIYLTGLFPTHSAAAGIPDTAVLFTLHFRVKASAPAGSYAMRLNQSGLCNGPAGWGTDVNNNGVYDGGDNDLKQFAPLVYSSLPDPRAGREEPDRTETEILLDDFENAPFFSFSVLDENGGGTDPGGGDDPGDGGGGQDADADNDGVPDDEDGCPADPLKTEPGTCGCGLPETDSDNDGIPDCRDVLLRPANGETGVSLVPVLEVMPFPGTEAAADDASIVWQISRDNAFTELVFEYAGPHDITLIQLPDFILDAFTTYYWRIRYSTGPDVPVVWEESGWFTTGPDAMTDENGNGIPDDQDVAGSEVPADFVSGGVRAVLASGADGLLYGLTFGGNVAGVDRFKWTDQDDFAAAGSWPEDFTVGLISFRLRTITPGDTVSVTILLSEAMPADASWFKTTVLQEIYDFGPYMTWAGDGRSAILTLTDGGPGDIDGVANGVIVDPGGIIGFAGVGGDKGGGGGGGSSGCFVGACGFSDP